VRLTVDGVDDAAVSTAFGQGSYPVTVLFSGAADALPVVPWSEAIDGGVAGGGAGVVTGGVTWAPVFEDTFDGPLNASKWHVQEGVHLHGVYTADNAFTANGSLVLRTVARNQTIDGVKYFVASGAVDTSGSLAQQYGAWEARLRMPDVASTTGFRLHSSMWLVNQLPWTSASGTVCPAQQQPEIDLVEYDPVEWTHTRNGTGPWAEGHFHAFFENCTSRWAPYKYQRGGAAGADFSADFHVWRVEWLEGSLTMLVDGVVLMSVTDAAWLRGLAAPLYFLLTNAIMTIAPPSAADALPQAMLIDYVRVWAAV
jgi:beta-glucanase (GH16 family)